MYHYIVYLIFNLTVYSLVSKVNLNLGITDGISAMLSAS